MTSVNEKVLFATLLELADTTTTGFDLVGLSDRLVGACVEVLGITAAGIMLADQNQSLRVFASSNEDTRILELFEIQNNDGPCLEAFQTGIPVEGVNLAQLTTRWPHFADAALAAGFTSAYAVPMRLRDQTIGALNLFQSGTATLSEYRLSVARVLADMAAIGIINHWSLRQQEVLAQQLQSALNTRVIIEQAKGVVAEREGISLGQAFEQLRATARIAHRPIADIAVEAVTGRVETNSQERSRPATPKPRTPPTGQAASPNRLPTGPQPGGSTVPGPGSPVVAEKESPSVAATGPEMSAAPGVVGLRELIVEAPPRKPPQTETALDLIAVVYCVSPADAFDLLSEASHDLRISLQDVAIRVVAEGRLPEGEILLARRLQRNPTSEEPDQDQTAPPATS
ncbi:MAG: ANTAR domain-containing protein [Propionicimonas sp.]